MKKMSLIFLFVLISTASLTEIANASEEGGVEDTKEVSPMLMVRTTLKSWHNMYNSYREEIRLGYCWADYFLDVKKFLNTLTGPRFAGVNHDDSSALIDLLKTWYDDGNKLRRISNDDRINNTEIGEGEYNEETGNPESKNFTNENTGKYIYPGIYDNLDAKHGEITKRTLPYDDKVKYPSSSHNDEDTSYLDKSRGLSDLFISAFGFDMPPGLGPLALGDQRTSPIVIVISRIIGTFMRVGRQVLDTIETTSILACTKEYLLVKIFRWIDS